MAQRRKSLSRNSGQFLLIEISLFFKGQHFYSRSNNTDGLLKLYASIASLKKNLEVFWFDMKFTYLNIEKEVTKANPETFMKAEPTLKKNSFCILFLPFVE